MLTVITGPPCSGKTTYLREHAQPGDVVIDYDDIAQAFGSPVSHGHNAAITEVTQRARGAAIQAAVRHSHHTDVWIIETSIPDSRAQLYATHDAHIVTLDVDAETLHARAMERPAQWHTLIDEWTPTTSQVRRWPSRPAHRKGTVGRPWRRYRKAKVDNATHCQNCGKPLVRDALCPEPTQANPNPHPNHRALGYCPTFHAYPTLQHPHRLVDGGAARDPDGLVWCYECNSRDGRPRAGGPALGQPSTGSRAW